MQVFGRKVWKIEKVRGGYTQTDVDEYFISQKVHTHLNTTMLTNYSRPQDIRSQSTNYLKSK